jgi:hypothetical protein
LFTLITAACIVQSMNRLSDFPQRDHRITHLKLDTSSNSDV